MKKPGEAVIKATKSVGIWVVILSILMQAVFLLVGAWNYKVLCANILTGFFSVFNFFLMGVYVEKATQKDEKDAKMTVKASQSLRTIMLFAAVAISVSFFDIWASIIPLFFPTVSILLQSFFGKNK
jgi:hypothetical protein